MVDNVQNSAAAAELFASFNAASTANTSSVAGTQDRFLKLLVTQMKNQDPLNPMDNAEVTSQMAQLSTVTGIDKLNATLQALSENLTGNQALQAASMIGHGVLIPGDGLSLSEDGAYGGLELTQSVDKLEVSIYDKAGALVRTVDLGPQPTGTVQWKWDGYRSDGQQAAEGDYLFTVNAKQGGKAVDAETLQFGMVGSVTQNNQGVSLNVGGTDGISLSQVRKIF